MNNSVFDKGLYYRWTYPRNWWDNIKLFFRQFKWAYQRITKGYCDKDIWNLDQYLLELLQDTLKQLAEVAHGWPDYLFTTYDEWIAYLRECAQLLYQADEANDFYPHPADDNYWKYADEHGWNSNTNPYEEAMIKEMRENEEKRSADFHKAWAMLEKVFFHLWD